MVTMVKSEAPGPGAGKSILALLPSKRLRDFPNAFGTRTGRMLLAARCRKGSVVSVLLVLFDAKGAVERTDRLVSAIEQYRDFLQLSSGTYLIQTELHSDEIFDTLKRKIGVDDNDSLIVLTVPQPYIGRAPARVKLWLLQQIDKSFDAGDSGAFLPD